MKGQHYLKIIEKSGWFVVYLHSELMSQKQPLAKFMDINDAIGFMQDKSEELKIGYILWEIK